MRACVRAGPAAVHRERAGVFLSHSACVRAWHGVPVSGVTGLTGPGRVSIARVELGPCTRLMCIMFSSATDLSRSLSLCLSLSLSLSLCLCLSVCLSVCLSLSRSLALSLSRSVSLSLWLSARRSGPELEGPGGSGSQPRNGLGESGPLVYVISESGFRDSSGLRVSNGRGWSMQVSRLRAVSDPDD